MDSIKNNIKLAITNLYSKKFFRNYDLLDLSGVDQSFVKQVSSLVINEIFTQSLSEVGKKRLEKTMASKFEELGLTIIGNDFSCFVEMKRLARGESRVYQIRKGVISELKNNLLKELKSASKVEKSLTPENIAEIFGYVAENLIFQKTVAQAGSTYTFQDPLLEEQVVDYWNEYYGVRFEELTHQDFDFSQINENISVALGESHKDLLENSTLFIEYHFEPSLITIKSINGVSLLDPIVVSNFDPRKKKRSHTQLEKLG